MVIQVAAGALTDDSGRLRSGRLLYFAAVQPQLITGGRELRPPY
jgi:hypothetical protein